ncbi:MAG: hypothetical protein JNM33_13845 [Rubrivivax sp.]|nr:hypothetical protein [Rubrivivax sp.]
MRRRTLLAGALPFAAGAWAAPAGGAHYTMPPGFTLLDGRGNPQVFGATLKPEPRANHAARIFIYAPVARPADSAGFTELFEREWRAEFGSLGVGDVVAHYRGRLPGGLACCFMGRFFERPGGAMYVVMYLLDLGDRAQLIAASVAPGWDGVNFPGAVEDHGLRSLAQQLFLLLDSLRAPGGRAPAAQPHFTRDDVLGRWEHQSGGAGGSFVDANSGAGLGTAVRGSASELRLGEDGRYTDHIAAYAFNPGTGTNSGPQAQSHAGRWAFDGEVITLQPDRPNGLDNRRRVAGVGRHAGGGRVLILLNPEGGAFKPVAWVPVWDGHAGVMRWYREVH